MLERQLGGRPSALSDAERAGYAREAAALLARIAADRQGPLAADLRTVEPALAVALNYAGHRVAAATALGELPDPDAQRSLADVVLDPSRPADLRPTPPRLLVAQHPAVRPPDHRPTRRPGSPPSRPARRPTPQRPGRPGDGRRRLAGRRHRQRSASRHRPAA